MKSFCWIILSLASLPAARAEFLYQPAAGASAVTIQAGYRKQQIFGRDVDSADPSTAKGLYRAGLGYEYGITDQLSLNSALTYTDLTAHSSGSSHISGVEPLTIGLRGHQFVDPETRALYGISAQVGLEKAATKDGGKGNNRSLGDLVDGASQTLTITPYLGVSTRLGAGVLGTVASYDIYKMDSTFDANASTDNDEFSFKLKATIKRGARSVWSGFYEHQLPGVLLGAHVAWIKQWELKISSRFGSAAFAGFGMMRAELYANVALSPTAALVPSIASTSTVFSDVSDDIDDQRVMLAYRQIF